MYDFMAHISNINYRWYCINSTNHFNQLSTRGRVNVDVGPIILMQPIFLPSHLILCLCHGYGHLACQCPSTKRVSPTTGPSSNIAMFNHILCSNGQLTLWLILWFADTTNIATPTVRPHDDRIMIGNGKIILVSYSGSSSMGNSKLKFLILIF